MSTENAQPILDQESETLLQESATPESPSSESSVAVAKPATLKPTANSEQERRVIAVRDINAKLAGLENNMSQLTDAFGQSQEKLKLSLSDLQLRADKMTADVVRVASRLEQSSQHQADLTKALDQRFTGSVTELSEQIRQANAQAQSQQACLERLESGQDVLQRWHDQLASRTTLHGEAIDALSNEARQQELALKALADDTRQQLQINRTHIEGLNALHREQKQALQALCEDFDVLTAKTNLLADQLTNLSVDVAADRRHNRKGFRIVAGALAGVAVLTFGVMAYLHYHPSTIPAAVKAQLAALSTAASQDVARDQALQAGVAGLDDKVTALAGKVDQQGSTIAALQAQSEQSATALQRVQKQQAALQRKVERLQKKVQQAVPAPTAAAASALPTLHDERWLAARPAEHFSIQVLGVSRLDYLGDYARQLAPRLKGQPLAYTKSQRQGGDWFTLFYGDFASREEAQQALAALPPALQRHTPWIRSLQSIQQPAP